MANLSDPRTRGPAGPEAVPAKAGTAASGSAAPNATTPSGAAFSATAASGSSSTAQAADPSLAGQYSRASRGGAAISGGNQSSGGPSFRETAQTAADALRQQASEFAGDVGHELSRTGETQKARGVEAMRGLARAIDSAAEELKDQSPTVARTVHEAARGVKSLSDGLSNRNVNELIDSATQLARAQPALFVGGSIAAGFAFARFLKSSAQHRPASGYDPYQP
jgi:hypothetical protein